MEDTMSIFLYELMRDLKANPDRYDKYSKIRLVRAIASFYEDSGYENLADIEDMSKKERREWMRGYF